MKTMTTETMSKLDTEAQADAVAMVEQALSSQTGVHNMLYQLTEALDDYGVEDATLRASVKRCEELQDALGHELEKLLQLV